MTEPEPNLLSPDEPVDLTNCDREPIHIPGAIQPHGVLLCLTERDLAIVQVSRNAAAQLGRPVGALSGVALDEVLAEGDLPAVRTVLAGLSEGRAQPITVTIRGGERQQAFLHRSGGLVVCELEPETASGGIEPTAFVKEVSVSMASMQGANGVADVSERAAAEVRRLTGYDRVMVYRFDSDGHGEVIAEARDQRLEPFLGLHYPATDIPRQARALYLRQTIRMIVDVDYLPSPIEPSENPLTGAPLDLSHSLLRSVSPIHLQYLRNMGVTGTMTISLTRDGELWGLIACHHYAPLHVPFSVRAACEFLGELLSFQFAREEKADSARERGALRATHAELLGLVRSSPSLTDALRAGTDLLLELCDADGVSIQIENERIHAGHVPEEAVESAIAARLPLDGSPLAVDRRPGEVPAAAGPTDLCGVLALRLPRGVGQHVIFYRREWRHDVSWGGDPGGSLTPDLSSRDTKTLSPRRSFAAWSQAVTGRSRPWHPAQIEAVTELGHALAEHMVAAMRDQLAHVALHDPLTGLPNRALLMESLHQILRRPSRGTFVGLLFLDVDNFKLINDSFGHRAGDLLLQQSAGRVGDALRHGDIVGRLGGDEFVVLLQNVEDPAELVGAAERIQSQFEQPFDLDGSESIVTVSIGIAWADPSHNRTPSDVLREADTAMYEAKRRGRGRSVQFHAELDETRRRRGELERHLQGALDRGELSLEYQPVFTAEGAVSGLEALARWESPALGRVGPVEFIPVAEDMGLIDELGDWVMQAAFARLAELRAGGDQALSMAINLSPRQLSDPSLVGRVQSLLDRLQIPRELACLEITEGALVTSGGPGIEILERLRALGVQVAIDDFGTGFSSLAYLRRLPADVLKIDRAFIAELGRERADRDIVGAVIDLARRLEIRTVAEGVETEGQLRILRELACDLVQGFLLARPLPAHELSELLTR